VLVEALVELVVIVIVAVSPVVFVLVCHLKLLDLEDGPLGARPFMVLFVF
jgi:hypothetical protein